MKFILGMLLLFSVTALSANEITLTDQNTLSLNGPVTGQSVTGLMVELNRLNQIQTEEPIYLVLNSPGGSVYAGFDFIRYAQTSRRKIETVTIFAASMAFQIVEAMGTRNVTAFSTLMSHKASGGFSGEFPGQLDSRYQHVLSHIAEQDKEVVSRTKGKQTLESYQKLIQNEYWANSERSIADGFADNKVSVTCDASLAGERSEEIDLGLFSLQVNFSKCPLITEPISVGLGRNYSYAVEKGIDARSEFKKIFSVKNFQY